MPHWNTHTVKKTGTTDFTVQLFKVSISCRAQHAEQYSKTGRTNPESNNLSWKLSRTYSRYQVFEKLLWKPGEKYFSKVNLEPNVPLNITRLLESFSTVSPIVNVGARLLHCAWPVNNHGLSLTRIQFHPQTVIPLANLYEVTIQRFFYSNSDAWGWHNSYQSGVVGITDQQILQNGENFEVFRRNLYRHKTLPHSIHDTTLASLARHLSTIPFYDQFDRNCADNT